MINLSCSVCVSPARKDIEEALAEKLSLRKIEARWNVSKSALSRHRKNQHDAVPPPTEDDQSAGHTNPMVVGPEKAETPLDTGDSELPTVAGKRGVEGLQGPELRALDALCKGGTLRQAAEAAGVSIRTLFSYRQKDAFAKYLRDYKEAQAQVFERRLGIAGSSAVGALSEIMENPVQKGVEAKTKAATALLGAQTRIATRDSKLQVEVAPLVPMIQLPTNTRMPWTTELMPVNVAPDAIDIEADEVVEAQPALIAAPEPVDDDVASIGRKKPKTNKIKVSTFEDEEREKLEAKIADKHRRMRAAQKVS